jgi:hypothetical protein
VSFRNRLTLFFIVIVIVPMIAVALVLFRLVSDAEHGKSDARLAQAERAAQGLFREFQDRAGDLVSAIGGDDELAAAIRDKDRAAVQKRLKELGGQQARRVVLKLDGLGTFELGDSTAIAPEGSKLTDQNDRSWAS